MRLNFYNKDIETRRGWQNIPTNLQQEIHKVSSVLSAYGNPYPNNVEQVIGVSSYSWTCFFPGTFNDVSTQMKSFARLYFDRGTGSYFEKYDVIVFNQELTKYARIQKRVLEGMGIHYKHADSPYGILPDYMVCI